MRSYGAVSCLKQAGQTGNSPRAKYFSVVFRITEGRRLRRFSREDESRRKTVDGHAQQHLRGLPQERSQNVQNGTGAERIDVRLNLADVDNQST
jgi:hypothetical protein